MRLAAGVRRGSGCSPLSGSSPRCGRRSVDQRVTTGSSPQSRQSEESSAPPDLAELRGVFLRELEWRRAEGPWGLNRLSKDGSRDATCL